MERLTKTDGIHLCYLVKGVCRVADQPGVHLQKFTWHPPGNFNAKWLTKNALALVAKGKTMATEASMGFPAAPGSAGLDPSTPGSNVENRLEAVKRKAALRSGRVTFNPAVQNLAPLVPGASGLTPLQAGPSATRASSSGLVPSRTAMMKQEPTAIESSGDEKIQPKDKKKKTLGASLALAVQQQQNKASRKEEKRKRDRSRSKSKKKKKKRSSSDDQKSKEEESESSDSMMPPLKKKSKKNPGSVFRLLEGQAVEALAQDGVVDEGFSVDAKGNNRVKLHTYFQLALRPHLDPKTRDCKELGLLARALDLLREGRLEEVADVLAARLIAVDTATRQGWGTARHLEIFGGEDVGTVPTHVLLSAQRYNRQVEKAGGKGSWQTAQTWQGNGWNTPKGRKGGDGKGKNKKGKGKGKNNWKGTPKEDENKNKGETS